MREAGDINRTLSALQNCISVIRQHQQTKTLSTSATFPHIPFRNSKLTQLLAPDLSGSGELALIVCVNGAPEFFDETTHVLEFSAVAGKVQLVQRPRIDTGLHSTVATPVVKTGTVRKRLRFDDAVTAESPLVRCDENCHEETESPYFECEGCEALYEQVLALRSELVLVDARVRQELTDEHAKNTERLQEHYHTSMMQSVWMGGDCRG